MKAIAVDSSAPASCGHSDIAMPQDARDRLVAQGAIDLESTLESAGIEGNGKASASVQALDAEFAIADSLEDALTSCGDIDVAIDRVVEERGRNEFKLGFAWGRRHGKAKRSDIPGFKGEGSRAKRRQWQAGAAAGNLLDVKLTRQESMEVIDSLEFAVDIHAAEGEWELCPWQADRWRGIEATATRFDIGRRLDRERIQRRSHAHGLESIYGSCGQVRIGRLHSRIEAIDRLVDMRGLTCGDEEWGEWQIQSQALAKRILELSDIPADEFWDNFKRTANRMAHFGACGEERAFGMAVMFAARGEEALAGLTGREAQAWANGIAAVAAWEALGSEDEDVLDEYCAWQNEISGR